MPDFGPKYESMLIFGGRRMVEVAKGGAGSGPGDVLRLPISMRPDWSDGEDDASRCRAAAAVGAAAAAP